ncbi:hypothetical protein DL98DRAFT_527284 [Cadophora sp. DSE1049]|nr:hypothetical protein DL98DRAFT_527284 [Cadophora sp. DSE1049]
MPPPPPRPPDARGVVGGIESAGDFAVCGQLEGATNPGLHLIDDESIGLPLSDRDVETITNASHRAPDGKGEEAIVGYVKVWKKVPGLFGTLIIPLPSAHEGGDVRVMHAGQKKILNTSIRFEFGYSYLMSCLVINSRGHQEQGFPEHRTDVAVCSAFSRS